MRRSAFASTQRQRALAEVRALARVPGPRGNAGPEGKRGPPGERGVKGETGRNAADLTLLQDYVDRAGSAARIKTASVTTSDGGRTLRWAIGETVHEIKTAIVLDAGVWKEGTAYVAGDGVTLGGSFFIAQADTVSQARQVGRVAPRRQARQRWPRCPHRTRARAGQVQVMHSILEIISEDPDSAGPDLVSLDDLKLALGIEGTTEDAALQAAITFQSRIIAEYCNRRFGLAVGGRDVHLRSLRGHAARGRR